jgi:hypothetical protein
MTAEVREIMLLTSKDAAYSRSGTRFASGARRNSTLLYFISIQRSADTSRG